MVSGILYVAINGITPTPVLGAGGSFASNWEQPIMDTVNAENDWIVAMVAADQSGTLYVEQSLDKTNVYQSASLATATDSQTFFSFPPPNPGNGQSAILKVQIVMPYVRVVFVNGASPQLIGMALTRRFVAT